MHQPDGTVPRQSGAISPALTAETIVAMIGGTLVGDRTVEVSAVAPIDRAGPSHLTFLDKARYSKLADERDIGVLLVTPELAGVGKPRARVVVDDPRDAMLPLMSVLYPPIAHAPSIHQTAILQRGVQVGEEVSLGPYVVIGRDAVIGARTRLEAGVVVGDGVTIGEDCRLFAGVTLYTGTHLGARVHVHSGANLGSDGFGYEFRDGAHAKFPHVGRCLVESDVEIGANTTIDRGSVDDTVIGAGTKIDNLVHIAHDARIGRSCSIMAQVGIGGFTHLADGCVLGGQSAVGEHLALGRRVRIGAQGGVCRSVSDGEVWSGYPARPHGDALRAQAAAFRLPKLIRALERLVYRQLTRDR